ncbi:hypothetical protein SO802_006928 [Lithocarpus litseifolius]|uniref:FAD-binding PCMH-type domain-containing protein n=1 Tax=Lithocarpus litseifolius TaxID=425828 RepID=A0AAW2DM88_9ROSI
MTSLVEVNQTHYCQRGLGLAEYGSDASFVRLRFNSRYQQESVGGYHSLSLVLCPGTDETAWVQAGATVGEVYYRIAEISKEHAFPAAVGLSVGTGGHFSGGGYGNMMRKYGLSVDNIIDVQIVNVNGIILDRKSVGEDLFWAIREGGGASFGVILSWKIKLVRVPAIVTVFHVNRTLEQVFWADHPFGTSINVLLQRPKQPVGYYKSRSDYVKEVIPKKALESIWKLMIKGGLGFMQWNPYGGRMNEISESETPFPHRAGNLFLIQYGFYWLEDGIDVTNKNLNLSKALHDAMTPYVSKSPREAFFCYRDLDIGANSDNYTSFDKAKVYGAKYFKGNFERLVRVKTMVDPTNFFKNEQSIPPLPNYK